MEVKIDKESNIIELMPRKLFPSGYDFNISFCDTFVCFTMTDGAVSKNVQISYEEWYQLSNFIRVIGMLERK